MGTLRGTALDIVEHDNPTRYALRVKLQDSDKEVLIPGNCLFTSDDYDLNKNKFLNTEDDEKPFLIFATTQPSFNSMGSFFETPDDLLYRVGTVESVDPHPTSTRLDLKVTPLAPIQAPFTVNSHKLFEKMSLKTFVTQTPSTFLSHWGVLKYVNESHQLEQTVTQIESVKIDALSGVNLVLNSSPHKILLKNFVSFQAFNFTFGKEGVLHFKDSTGRWTQKSAVLKSVERDSNGVVGVTLSFLDDPKTPHTIPLTNIKSFKALALPLNTLGLFFVKTPQGKVPALGSNIRAMGREGHKRFFGKVLDVVWNPSGHLEFVVEVMGNEGQPLNIPLGDVSYFSHENLPQFGTVGILEYTNPQGQKTAKPTKLVGYNKEDEQFQVSHLNGDGVPLKIPAQSFLDFQPLGEHFWYGKSLGKWIFQNDLGVTETLFGEFQDVEETPEGVLVFKMKEFLPKSGEEPRIRLMPAWHFQYMEPVPGFPEGEANQFKSGAVGYLRYIDANLQEQFKITKLVHYNEEKNYFTVCHKDEQGHPIDIPAYFVFGFVDSWHSDKLAVITFRDQDQKVRVHLATVGDFTENKNGVLHLSIDTFPDHIVLDSPIESKKTNENLLIPAWNVLKIKYFADLKLLKNDEWGELKVKVKKSSSLGEESYMCQVDEVRLNDGEAMLGIIHLGSTKVEDWIPLKDVVSFVGFDQPQG